MTATRKTHIEGMTMKTLNLIDLKEVDEDGNEVMYGEEGRLVPHEVGDLVSLSDANYRIVRIGNSLDCFPGGKQVREFGVELYDRLPHTFNHLRRLSNYLRGKTAACC